MLEIIKTPILNTYNVYMIIVLMILLGIAAYIDFKHLKIPNKLNLTIVITRIILIPFIGMISLQNILCVIISFLFFLIPAMILNHRMGGDIKCISALALFFNVKAMLLFLLCSCLMSLVVHIYMRSKFNMKLIPFAPFFFMSHILFSTFSILCYYGIL